MGDKRVEASGPGSIAIGRSARKSKITTNVIAGGTAAQAESLAKDGSPDSIVSSAPGAIALGGDAFESEVTTVVRAGELSVPPDAPVVFPALDPPVDLMLRIARIGTDRLRFDAYTADQSGRAGRRAGPLEISVGGTSERFAKRLSELARDRAPGDASADRELRSIGDRIAKRIPENLLCGKNALLGAALRAKRPPSILLLTDDAVIPWELALISGLDPADPDHGRHLGEIANVARWPIGIGMPAAPRAAIDVPSMHAFAADQYTQDGTHGDLPQAVEERQFLAATFGAAPHNGTKAGFSNWFESDPVTDELLHIALHGYSAPTASDEALILADGTTLSPDELRGMRGDGRSRRYSLVFLNACQTGTAGESLGQVAGFPGTLISGGAGAVIAPLWEVHDREARRFAECFYTRVFTDGTGVGNAMRIARRRDPAVRDISPFAYIFYGHPLLQLTQA